MLATNNSQQKTRVIDFAVLTRQTLRLSASYNRNQTKTKTNFCSVTASVHLFISFHLLNRQQTKEANVSQLALQSKGFLLMSRTGRQKENKTCPCGTGGIFVEACELSHKHKSVTNNKK